MKWGKDCKGSVDDKTVIPPLLSVMPGQKLRKIDLFNKTNLPSLLKSAHGEKLETKVREEASGDLIPQDQTIQKLRLQMSQRDAAIKQLEELITYQQKILEENLRSTEQDSKDSQEEVSGMNHQLVEEDNSVTVQKGKECRMHLESFRREALNLRKEEDQDRTINELKQIIQQLQDSIEEKRITNVALNRSIKLQKKTISELRSRNMMLRLRSIQGQIT
jgi:hypothetical protein